MPSDKKAKVRELVLALDATSSPWLELFEARLLEPKIVWDERILVVLHIPTEEQYVELPFRQHNAHGTVCDAEQTRVLGVEVRRWLSEVTH